MLCEYNYFFLVDVILSEADNKQTDGTADAMMKTYANQTKCVIVIFLIKIY